jgi:hypothetical protein
MTTHPVGFLPYFFTPAIQFVTTVSRGEAPAIEPLTVLIRKRVPSARCSIRKVPAMLTIGANRDPFGNRFLSRLADHRR